MIGVDDVLIILGVLGGAKGAHYVFTKGKIRFAYKKSKKGIYKQIKKNLKEENVSELHSAIGKLRELYIEHQSDKLERFLTKMGIPSEIVDTVDSISHWLEEAKDKLVDLVDDNPEIIKIIDEKVSIEFEMILAKTRQERQVIDNMNLTEIIEQAQERVKESIKNEIMNGLKLGNDKLRQENEEMERAKLIKQYNDLQDKDLQQKKKQI